MSSTRVTRLKLPRRASFLIEWSSDTAGRAWNLVRIHLPGKDQAVDATTFRYELDREKLRQPIRREGRYLLRSNMETASPETVWENYLLLTRIEQA